MAMTEEGWYGRTQRELPVVRCPIARLCSTGIAAESDDTRAQPARLPRYEQRSTFATDPSPGAPPEERDVRPTRGRVRRLDATAWRYVDETLDVLAAWAPGLHEALTGLGEDGFVIVDGTLIPTDRIAADEPYYSQKHKRHGMNVQVIARPDGTPLWFSRATPGRTHDLTAARAHGIVQACLARQTLVLADRAYQGVGATIRPPCYRHREHPYRYQQFNRDHARLRAPGERTFALPKPWLLLR